MRGRAALSRFRCSVIGLVALVQASLVSAAYSPADDLPGPPSHLETVPAGSLVIPMDNTLQNLVAPFNIKAYGLACLLLTNGVPLKWAIRAGKAKDEIDFTASAQRIAPSAGSPGSFGFAGGPFIIHRDFAQFALAYINSFGGNVAVYQLTADAVVDVRYDLHHRPSIAVNTVNSAIHTDLYDAAGIPNYSVIDVSVPGSIGPDACYTHISEPHTTVTAGIADVKAFVESGGNFLAECRSIETYENDPAGQFQTTAGIVINNINNDLNHPNADLAFSQFVGVLDPAPGGSEQDWVLAAGSVFQNNGHVHADNTGAATPTYAATAAKLFNGPGGNVFYIGGHDYGAGGSSLNDLNGQRMILNAIFVPTTRPLSCGLDFLANLRTFTGRVVEDVNGDSNLSDGVGRPSVNVRLYADLNNNGVVDAGDFYLGTTTTDANGNYSLRASTYVLGTHFLVAVDSKSITPSAGLRPGFTQGDVWAAQTYGDDPSTVALDLGARYGGASPNSSDSFDPANTAPANNSYKHVARIDATAGDVSGVDFGFSFNVVTTLRGGDSTDDDPVANRTVQGSFRQFIQNANAITGANAMRFVPAVAANAGTWWRLSVTSALPPVTDASTTIDGRAYNSSDGTTVLDTNPGTAGAGGSVGVDALSLTAVAKPELEIQDLRSSAILAIGLDLQAANAAVRRVAIYGFGNAGNSDAAANIRIGSTAASAIVEENIVGSSGSSFTDPGAALRSAGDNIRLVGGSSATIQNNLIGFSGGNGIGLSTNATGAQMIGNEIRGNALGNSTLSGVNIGAGSSGTVQGNLIVANLGAGVDVVAGAGVNNLVNNTVSGNGGGGGGAVTAGVRLLGSSQNVDRNVITANTGSGVLVGSGAGQDTITKNSIFNNGAIGIDLLGASDNQSTGTAPYVTPNDNGDVDTGGNGLLNFPVITSAATLGSNLVINGFARPGSVIELFLADGDPSGFGEGKTFLVSVTEGSGQDNDATTGAYTSPVNGKNQGADTTNRFSFTVPAPPGVAVGSVLTATATLANATSEFSGTVTVILGAAISGYIYTDANLNLMRDSSESGTGLTLYVKLVNTSNPAGPAVAAVAADPVTGAYNISNVPSGVYTLILDDNNTLSDVTPSTPAGWSGTEMAGGIRTPVGVGLVPLPSQNFGLYHGMLITGHVFNDNGSGGGVANDGILNGTEPGLAGISLRLTDNGGVTTYATTTSNSSGAYALSIPSTVAPGTGLKIVCSSPGGYLSTGANLGNTGGSFDRPNDTISFNVAANTSYNSVDFGAAAPNVLNTDGQQAGLPGTTLFYPHTFVAGSAGSVTFSTSSVQNPVLAGWSATLYRDLNGNGQLDANEPAITGPITVNAGETISLIIKLFIPANASFGGKDQTTLTATFIYSGAAPALGAGPLTRVDVTTVGNPTTAGLTLSKAVDKPTANPGEVITYTVTYTNTSSDVLRNVVIYDSTPAFTKFTSGSNGALPLDLTSVVFTSPPVGQTGAMRWTFAGTLRPGGSGTVTFKVTLDQ